MAGKSLEKVDTIKTSVRRSLDILCDNKVQWNNNGIDVTGVPTDARKAVLNAFKRYAVSPGASLFVHRLGFETTWYLVSSKGKLIRRGVLIRHRCDKYNLYALWGRIAATVLGPDPDLRTVNVVASIPDPLPVGLQQFRLPLS